MTKAGATGKRREKACQALIAQARAIVDAEGRGEGQLGKIKALLVELAPKSEKLLSKSDFAMPDSQGRNHVLATEDSDGMGLYLTIALPGERRRRTTTAPGASTSRGPARNCAGFTGAPMTASVPATRRLRRLGKTLMAVATENFIRRGLRARIGYVMRDDR
jgi:hypothetical protein